jgi:hypothetical protein
MRTAVAESTKGSLFDATIFCLPMRIPETNGSAALKSSVQLLLSILQPSQGAKGMEVIYVRSSDS